MYLLLSLFIFLLICLFIINTVKYYGVVDYSVLLCDMSFHTYESILYIIIIILY